MIVYGHISCTVFVYMLMRDVSLKQRIPCIIRISIFGAFSAGKKCALYKGKYGTDLFASLRQFEKINDNDKKAENVF